MADQRVNYFDIPNARIAVQEFGQGDPIMFIHGNPDSGELWGGVVQHLSSSYRCIVPDLPGYGRSTAAPDYDLSLDNRGRFVGQVADAVGITGKFTVVAHDHGGPFGIAFAIQNPGRLRALCIADTLFHHDYHWHFWGRVWRTPILGEISLALTNWPIFVLELRRGSGWQQTIPIDHMRATFRAFTPGMKRIWLRLYRETSPAIFTGWDEKFIALLNRVPTLVLWGARDPYIPVTFAERLQAHGAELHRFPEYGHWLMVEAPDKFAHQIHDFLQRQL
jgi:pimeloyl-ACP methyl ester carboxylesterase